MSRHFRLVLIVAILFLNATPTFAQTKRRLRPVQVEEEKTPATATIWVDPTILLPIGDWADVAGLGLGLVARAEVPMKEALKGQIWATLRCGYLFHLKEGLSQIHSVPMLLGSRYGKTFSSIELMFGLEFGGFHRVERKEILDRIDTETELSVAFGSYLGFRALGFDLRAGVFYPDVTKVVSDLGAWFTIGYLPRF